MKSKFSLKDINERLNGMFDWKSYSKSRTIIKSASKSFDYGRRYLMTTSQRQRYFAVGIIVISITLLVVFHSVYKFYSPSAYNESSISLDQLVSNIGTCHMENSSYSLKFSLNPVEEFGISSNSSTSPLYLHSKEVSNIYQLKESGNDLCASSHFHSRTCVFSRVQMTHNLFFSKEIYDIKCLPKFIIIGVMKSGTGELMKWLNYHPHLKSGRTDSQKNELHFFGQHFSESKCPMQSYLDNFESSFRVSHFDTALMSKKASSSAIFGFDKSPDYIRDKTALIQIRKFIPDIKLVLLLRNPTTRAISGFNHNCRHRRYVRIRNTIKINESVVFAKGTLITSQQYEFWHDHLQKTLSTQAVSLKYYSEPVGFPCNEIDFHSYYFGSLPKNYRNFLNQNNSNSSLHQVHANNKGSSFFRSFKSTHDEAMEGNHSTSLSWLESMTSALHWSHFGAHDEKNRSHIRSENNISLLLNQFSLPELSIGYYDEQLSFLLKLLVE